jgi:hypothetical protein
VDKLGSLREMQLLSDRHKIAEVAQVHRFIPSNLSLQTS